VDRDYHTPTASSAPQHGAVVDSSTAHNVVSVAQQNEPSSSSKTAASQQPGNVASSSQHVQYVPNSHCYRIWVFPLDLKFSLGYLGISVFFSRVCRNLVVLVRWQVFFFVVH